MTQSASSIFDQRVYAQSTEPTDTRDGNLWADTSSSPPVVKVYSSGSSSWERAAPSSVKVQDAEPTSGVPGDLWVNTSVPSNPRLRVYDVNGWSQIGYTKLLSDPTDTSGNRWDGDRSTFEQVDRGAGGATLRFPESGALALGDVQQVYIKHWYEEFTNGHSGAPLVAHRPDGSTFTVLTLSDNGTGPVTVEDSATLDDGPVDYFTLELGEYTTEGSNDSRVYNLELVAERDSPPTLDI